MSGETHQSKKLRIEILVASPPTKKCKAMIALFEQFLEEFPARLTLNIYHAGEPMTGNPTKGFKNDSAKIRKIPTAYVNGINVAKQIVPQIQDVRNIILDELSKPESEWQ